MHMYMYMQHLAKKLSRKIHRLPHLSSTLFVAVFLQLNHVTADQPYVK